MNQNEIFLRDVLDGLSSKPRKLPSKYFYNEQGDKLFHYIMNQPEYYLTCAEYEILQTHKGKIQSHINTDKLLRIIEPGAGDGFKSKILLEVFLNKNYNLIYNPIDISPNVLDILCQTLVSSYPNLQCEPLVADYLDLEGKIPKDDHHKLMLFLGSNIGNFNDDDTITVIQKFSETLNSGDYFLLGVDMVKNPNRILAAYNDVQGVTSEFNFNLLLRINSELGGNFNPENFMHYPVYNPVLQQAESYMVSRTEQEVSIGEQKFYFRPWEPVLMEISRKFTPSKIESMAFLCGFSILDNFYDINHDFCCSLWKKS